MNLVKRELYLAQLRRLCDKNLIKVVTGIRRCGKSTILQMFRDELLAKGVTANRIAFVNFEEFENAKYLHDCAAAYYDIIGRLDLTKPCYVFLDEVQNVKEFERLVDGLFVKPNVDLYVTGSNAYLLSGELATLLTGRYIEIHAQPFSFAEYVSLFPSVSKSELLNQYIANGGMPGTVGLSELDAVPYLKNIYQSIIKKDVLTRHRWHADNQFERVTQFIFDSIGLFLSPTKIAATLQASGVVTSKHSIANYLDALTESFLFYKVRRFDVRGKKILSTQEKYYAADLGFKRAITGEAMFADMGRNLENMVFLELLRRGNEVFIGKADNSEIDFVARPLGGSPEYIQVAYTAKEEATRKREMHPFTVAKDYNRRTLITTDHEPTANINGIRKIYVADWLLENQVTKSAP
ncbi:MAG: ATP-binding protein [Verrucomicrobiales bacterium]|jgi:predicted AAA+ superfamily ATPase|nr:ATP-binding protein [Verrucomicrobiales bacterium]